FCRARRGILQPANCGEERAHGIRMLIGTAGRVVLAGARIDALGQGLENLDGLCCFHDCLLIDAVERCHHLHLCGFAAERAFVFLPFTLHPFTLHEILPFRISPTASPSIASGSRFRSTYIGLKSGFSGSSCTWLPWRLKRFTVTSSCR